MSFLIDPNILKQRNSAIDIYRGIAVLLVIFFHYKHLIPFGLIGVDLFFVLSGFLVSKPLLTNLFKNKKPEIKDFYIKRIFKIIPSYYFFIICGTVLARLIFLENYSEQVISAESLPSYLLFYLNYDITFNWVFELSWSLCVEEHFYLFLGGLMFMLFLFGSKFKKQFIRIVYGLIFLAIGFKVLGYYKGWSTYEPSHMRMDALFYGVLLSYQFNIKQNIKKTNLPLLFIGLFALIIALIIYVQYDNLFYEKALFHSIIPVLFYYLIRATLLIDFSKLKFLRIIAYYSYNWYLWHAFVAFIVINMLELNLVVGLPIYLIGSFMVAVLTTKIIEEPILKLRKRFLKPL